MSPLLFFGLFVAASAAPQFFDHHPHFGPRRHLSPYFQDDLFRTENFWDQLSQELRQLDNMLEEFSKNFPKSTSTEGIEGNEYKITIPLTGFEEKDIIVKAREGMLMIQAVHKIEEGTQKSYLEVRTLPNYVNVTGNWTYKDGVLKIVFPLNPDAKRPEETTEVVATEGYKGEESREELEPTRGVNEVNADVGLERGDQEKDTHLLTNEIPRNTVEATTYAVDLKDEVEFVPVRY